MYEYLILMLVFVILPLAILWIIKWKTIKKYKLTFILASIGAIIFGFPWDYVSIKSGIWQFTNSKILNIWFLGLPIEEWFFFIFVTLLFATITALLWEKYGVKE